MFGKILGSVYVGYFVLGGIAGYIIWLFIMDYLTLYLHPRYVLFSLVMAVLGLSGLVIGFIVNYLRKSSGLSKFVVFRPGRRFRLELLAVIIVIAMLIVPPMTLSQRAVGRKSINTPNSVGLLAAQADTACLDEDPVGLEGWVFYIAQYSPSCYLGRDVVLQGFAVESKSDPAPEGYFYFGKLLVSCCVIDARPYALPVEITDLEISEGSWYEVSGSFEIQSAGGREIVVLTPREISEIEEPASPYEFFGR